MSQQPHSNFSSTVCKGLDILFGRVVTALSKLDLGKTLNIFRIDEHCVWLDMSGNYKLYGIKIEGKDNTVKRFGEQMSRIASNIRYADNSEIVIFFVKREKRQAVYLFAFDQRIIGTLSREFSIPNLRGEEITSSLLDILHAQHYKIDNNRMIRSGFAENPFIPYGLEMASGKFRERAMVAVDNILREFSIYQGEEYESIGEFNPIDLFKANWEGTFGLWINFSLRALNGRVRQYEKTAKFGDKEFAQECAKIIERDDQEFSKYLEEESLLVNSFLFLKDEYSLQALESKLSIKFNKNYLTGPKILAKTLLLARDSAFDAILPKETVLKYLASSHKAPSPSDVQCDFYGADVSGNFIEYSFATNNNPHSMLAGQTGSGKSVKAICILEKIVGFDQARRIADRLHNQWINFVDVGYTSGNIISDLKAAHPNEVEIFGSDVNGLRFGLFDFELKANGTLDDDEKNFFTSFISFALEVDGEDPLTGLESDLVKASLEGMLRISQTNEMFISHLENNGGYTKVVNELFAQGYGPNTKLKELPAKYNFLKKRSMNDLFRYLSETQHHLGNTDEEKKVYESLLLKLKMLTNNNMINLVANTEISSSKQIFHIDLQTIKDDKRSFMLTYWLLMKNWMKQFIGRAKPYFDAGKKPPPTYFFIEESHNFFVYQSFAVMLKTMVKETRKFGGRFFFISQDPSDVPEIIYQELGTKMFVVTEAERQRFKTLTAKVYEQKNMEPIYEIIDKMGDRDLLILGKNGAIACNMEVSREWEYYNPKIIA